MPGCNSADVVLLPEITPFDCRLAAWTMQTLLNGITMNSKVEQRNFLLPTLLILVLAPIAASGQERDLRAERIVLDDNGDDGATNTITIESPLSLGQNVVLTLSDPGSDSATLLLSPGGTGIWFLGGNAGTNPGTNFLGTTDATALHLYVNGGADNSLILNTDGSLQRDVSGDARGQHAVDLQRQRSGPAQVSSGDYSMIGGGQDNAASGVNSVAAGGNGNTASGNGASVGGGIGNTASGSGATVGGGQGNSAEVSLATVGGGYQNRATGFRSTVAGGRDNWVNAQNATIGGGVDNYVEGSRGVVAGGDTNVVIGSRSAIGGGLRNKIEGIQSAIPGGSGLTLDVNADDCFGFLGGSGAANPMTINTPDVAVFGNTDLWLANNDNGAGRLLFYEPNNSTGAFPAGTNYTAFRAGAQGTDLEYVWPATAPTAGQVLKVSGVSGASPTVVTLGWSNDATSAGFSGWDTPTSIGTTDSRDVLIATLVRSVNELRTRLDRLEGPHPVEHSSGDSGSNAVPSSSE